MLLLERAYLLTIIAYPQLEKVSGQEHLGMFPALLFGTTFGIVEPLIFKVS